MSTIATIEVTADAFALGAVLDTGRDVRIDLAPCVPVRKARLPYFWAADDGVDGFVTDVEGDPRVETLTPVCHVDGRTLYRMAWRDDGDDLLGSLATHEILVERGVAVDDTWVFHLRSADRTVLSAFRTDCSEKAIPVEIRRIVDNSGSFETDRFDLTTKQHAALTAALEAGYFDVPRETTLTELAEGMGISRQAFSRRLNRGLRGLLTNTLGSDVPGPGL